MGHVQGILVLSDGVSSSLKYEGDPARISWDGIDGKRIIVLFKPKSVVNHDQNCGNSGKGKCYGKSKCVKFPHSAEEQCQCPSGYDGTICNERSNTTFLRTLSTLMTETAKVPQLSDVYFELQDAREEMRKGFDDEGKARKEMREEMQKGFSDVLTSLSFGFAEVEEAIIQIEEFISNKLGKLSINMNKLFTIASFQTKYSTKLQDMNHAIKLSKPIFDMFKKGNKYNTNSWYRKKAIKKAEDYTDKIPSWELTLQDMFNGDAESLTLKPLKPLMLLVIDIFKNDACLPKYKEHIDQLYRKFLLLQSDLFMMHASALHILGQDTTEVGENYKKRLAQQVCFRLNILG